MKKSVGLMMSFLFSTSAFAAGVYPGIEAPMPATTNWLGVVGDSGTTGAASDKNLQPNLQTLLGFLVEFAADPKLKDVQPDLGGHPLEAQLTQFSPPLRVYYTDGEAQVTDTESLENGMKAALRLDVEENSFGYQYGIAKGVAPENIVFVGQDGSRVDAIPKQIARLFEKPAETLPPVVLVSFNANDFCDNNIFTDDLGQRTQSFATTLAEAWDRSAALLKSHPNGTRFIVLSPIEVANVLTNAELLSQQINFEGHGGMSCRDLREADFPARLAELNDETDFLKKLGQVQQLAELQAPAKVQEALVGMCAAVLGTRPNDQDRLHVLQQVQSQFRQVWRDQIAKLNGQYNAQNLRWDFVESIADIGFVKGDAANDCFHPSASGHAKITGELLKLN